MRWRWKRRRGGWVGRGGGREGETRHTIHFYWIESTGGEGGNIGSMLSCGCVVHLPWPLQAFGHSAIAVEARPAANSKYLDIVTGFFLRITLVNCLIRLIRSVIGQEIRFCRWMKGGGRWTHLKIVETISMIEDSMINLS